jgi:hypothetical protein
MSAETLTSTGILILALSGVPVALFIFRGMPRATFVAWGFVMFFVPVWIGVSVGIFWAAITLITLLALAVNLGRIQWHIADVFMLVFVVLAVALFGLGRVSLSALVTAMLEWIVPYAWGRIVLNRVHAGFIYKAIAALAAVAAALALIEFATSTNVFVLLPPGGSFDVWGPLQWRGGFLRAEGAFGHSIALGASLAISTAFLLATTWHTLVKVALMLLIAGAIVVTFSRIGLISFVITVALSLLFQERLARRTKVTIVIVGAIAAFAIVPFVSSVFLDAGSEATGSADYRGNLFLLVTQLKLVGSAGGWEGLSVDGTYLGSLSSSVDNALLVIALRFGILPVLLLIVLLVMLVVSVLIPGRANPASIAIVAQIPAFFTVALITQYGMFVWFAAGLAVALGKAGTTNVTTDDAGLSHYQVPFPTRVMSGVGAGLP